MSEIVCPSCGVLAPAGAVFCDNCGFDLRHVAPSAPAASAAAQMAIEPAVADSPAGTNCPHCGHLNIVGAVFCENCGEEMSALPAAQSLAVPAPEAEGGAAVEIEPPAAPPAQMFTTVIGRLTIRTTNTSLDIPAGKQVIVIGREDPVSGIFPDIDLDPHGGLEAGVGRQHAQINLQNGQLFLEDLSSVNGTALNRQRLAARQPASLQDGDEIRLGKLILIYTAS